MNQPSAFQLQYPLSPRKFWKKVFSATVFAFFESLFFGVVGTFILSSSKINDNFLILFSIFITIFLVMFTVIVALCSFYIKVYIKRYYYDCGEHFITIKKGVFAPTEIHVQYQKIQDVYVDQDVLDRIMGLYDVHIASATATSGIEAHIDGVSLKLLKA